MSGSRLRSALLVVTAGLGLSASSYNDGYGYSRVTVGYGSAGYCDPYWDDCYYGGYGRGHYGDPWYGWYDDFYYPGIGIFIYDRDGRRHRWSDHHRRHWEGRRHHWRGRDWNDRRWENWGGFRRDGRDGRDWRDRRRRGATSEGLNDRSQRRDWTERQSEMRRPQAVPEATRPARTERGDYRRVRTESRSRNENRGRWRNRED
jgi:hypothetical protein